MDIELVSEALLDKLVIAVREHPKLGRGTCSTLDECYNDKDLKQLLLDRLSDHGAGPNNILKRLQKEEDTYWEVQEERDAAAKWMWGW